MLTVSLAVWGAAWGVGIQRWKGRAPMGLALGLVLVAGVARAALPRTLLSWRGNLFTFSVSASTVAEDLLKSPVFHGLAPRPVGENRAPGAPGVVPGERNVLVIVVESLGERVLNDAQFAELMPNIARRLPSLRSYPRHYAPYAFSSKALYGLVCGDVPYPSMMIELRVPGAVPCSSFARVLAERGYTTWAGYSGDLHYDRMGDFLGRNGFAQRVDLLSIQRQHPGRHRENSWGLDDAALVEQFERFVTERGEEPFAALAIPVNSHHPWWTPDPAFEKFDEAWKNAFHYQDHLLERYFQVLEKHGLLDRTLVVITGDHGRRFHETAQPESMDEAEYHVPLWMHVPGDTAPAPSPTQPTSHLGLGGEILRLLGFEHAQLSGQGFTDAGAVLLLGTRTPSDFMLLEESGATYFLPGEGRAYRGDTWVHHLERECGPGHCLEERQQLLDYLNRALERFGKLRGAGQR
jgi:phosphoglycerol transferase MdoB-like AlkP superfamily enzyme